MLFCPNDPHFALLTVHRSTSDERIAEALQNFDRKYLGHSRMKLKYSHCLASGQIDHTHSTAQFVSMFGDRHTTKTRSFANLRKPDKRELATERQTTRVSRNCFDLMVFVQSSRRPNPTCHTPSSAPTTFRRKDVGEWGIESPRQMTSPDGTSMMTPLVALFGRHPAAVSVSLMAVT